MKTIAAFAILASVTAVIYLVAWIGGMAVTAHKTKQDTGYSQTLVEGMPRYTTTRITIGDRECAFLILDRGNPRMLPLYCGPVQ